MDGDGGAMGGGDHGIHGPRGAAVPACAGVWAGTWHGREGPGAGVGARVRGSLAAGQEGHRPHPPAAVGPGRCPHLRPRSARQACCRKSIHHITQLQRRRVPPPAARCLWARTRCWPTAAWWRRWVCTWWRWRRGGTPSPSWCWWGCTSSARSSPLTPSCSTTVRRGVGRGGV